MGKPGRDVSVLFAVSTLLPLLAQAAETDIISTDTATYILIGIAVLYSIISAALALLLILCLCYCIRQRSPEADDLIPLTPFKGGGKHEKPIKPPPKVQPDIGIAPEVNTSKYEHTEEVPQLMLSEPSTVGGPTVAATTTPGSHLASHESEGHREQVPAEPRGPDRHVPSARHSPQVLRKANMDPTLTESSLVTASASATPGGTLRHSETSLSVLDNCSLQEYRWI